MKERRGFGGSWELWFHRDSRGDPQVFDLALGWRLRFSRHYFDMHRLALSPVREKAVRDMKLLADVVEFKQRFYPSSWARYEDAKPGTLRLVPPDERLEELRRGYRDMRQMLFGDVPEFDHVIATLRSLEADVNSQ